MVKLIIQKHNYHEKIIEKGTNKGVTKNILSEPKKRVE